MKNFIPNGQRHESNLSPSQVKLKNTSLFDPRLESLRGIAAIAVVLAHASAVLKVDGSPAFWAIPFANQTITQQILSLLFAVLNPSAAVILFFVLSGYVLTLSLKKRQQQKNFSRKIFSNYLIRRGFRLLPALWASILLTAIIRFSIPAPANFVFFSDWYRSLFETPLDWRDVVQNCLLFKFAANPVTWTLYVEVIGSLFIPLCLILANYCQPWIMFGLSFVLATLTGMIYPNFTGTYLICFQVGLLLAIAKLNSRGLPSRIMARCPSTIYVGIGITLFVIERLYLKPAAVNVLLLTLGSGALLMGITAGFGQKTLFAMPLQFLGKISYSLYLVHTPILYGLGVAAVAWGWSGQGLLTSLGMFGIAVPVSILLGWLGFTTIEKTSIALGRRFG